MRRGSHLAYFDSGTRTDVLRRFFDHPNQIDFDKQKLLNAG